MAEITTPFGNRNVRAFRLLVYLLFFVSGATGLIHEVLWQRMLLLILGASASSVLAVFTAFFVGIAVGSSVGGRLLRSGWKPLRLYGWAELTIAVTGLAVPLIFKAVDMIYYSAASQLEDGHWFSDILRFVLATVCILPATAAMGATIPAMAKVVSGVRGDGDNSGRGVSIAYGLNILGGMVGCLVAGLVLIRFLGVSRSLFANVALNFGVAVVALLLAGRNLRLTQPRKSRERPELFQAALPRAPAFAIYGLAGAGAIAFEIVWFRMFSMLSGAGTIHFSTFLAVFLGGFGAGGLVIYPFLSSRLAPRTVLWLSLAGSGLFSLVTCLSAFGLVQGLAYEVQLYVQQWMDNSVKVMMHATTAALVLMFIPTVFMGMTFPAAVKVIAGNDNPTDAATGDLYFAGNIGSAAGALVGGLILIPISGIAGSAGVLSALLLLLAAACAVTMGAGRILTWFATVAPVIVALVALAFAWDNRPVISRFEPAFRKDGQWHERVGKDLDLPLVRYEPGASGTVLVRDEVLNAKNDQGDPLRAIFVDELQVASTTRAARVDGKMLAHLPLMLHPDPKRALTVGFGSGGTSWSMTRHGILATAVEIEREVIRSAHLFETQNFGVVDHPLLTVVINDARDHINTTPTRYDVISSDVTNINYRQNNNLYTVEFFELMAKNLAEGGIACSWIPGEMPAPAMKILLRSFQEVFPHTSVWYMNHSDTSFLILIGTESALQLDFARIEQAYAIPEVQKDLRSIDVTHPYQIASCLVADEQTVRQWTEGSPLHTDDHPNLEYAVMDWSTPPSVNLGNTLIALSKGLPPIDWFLDERVDQQILRTQIRRGHGYLRARLAATRAAMESDPIAQLEHFRRGEQITSEILHLLPGDLVAQEMKRHFSNQRQRLEASQQ